MTDKVIIVTSPDDTTLDGIRLLLVNLSQEQGQEVSTALMNSNLEDTTVVYIWNNESVQWLLDKKAKSDLIIFNAESNNDILVGYLSAQPKSYYFGTLKDLHLANNRAIYNAKDVLTLLEKISKNHDKI